LSAPCPDVAEVPLSGRTRPIFTAVVAASALAEAMVHPMHAIRAAIAARVTIWWRQRRERRLRLFVIIDPSRLAAVRGSAGMMCPKPGLPHRANAYFLTRDV
jgi:hypothetical protein